MKFVIYQRRQVIEALKTKAMLHAMLGDAENAETAAKEYFQMAVPMEREAEEVKTNRQEQLLAEIEDMGPLRFENGTIVVP